MEKVLQKWHEYIAIRHKELNVQLEEVATNYPLVALAYRLQQAQAFSKWMEHIEQLVPTTMDSSSWKQFQEDYQDRKRKRERCLGSASTPGEAYQCLSDHPPI